MVEEIFEAIACAPGTMYDADVIHNKYLNEIRGYSFTF